VAEDQQRERWPTICRWARGFDVQLHELVPELRDALSYFGADTSVDLNEVTGEQMAKAMFKSGYTDPWSAGIDEEWEDRRPEWWSRGELALKLLKQMLGVEGVPRG
jgi:hypothetical protein